MPPYVNEETKIYSSTVYTRGSSKRTFGFVIKGMIISATLLASIASGGFQANAASIPSIPPTTAAQQVQADFEDEATLIANLNMAVKAIKEEGWTTERLTKIMDQLTLIEDRLFDGNIFKGKEELRSHLKIALTETESVFTAHGADGLPTLRESNAPERLYRMQEMLGMRSTRNNVNLAPIGQKNEVKIASAAKDEVSVFIDGVKQNFPQSAIVKNGNTLVPMRGVFEALKADVKWDQPTQTATATKGNTTIKLTIGQSTAYVNGKAVQLAAKGETINGATMVPLRFVSEALGGEVKWDATTMTAYITSSKSEAENGTSKQQVVKGIKVKYGQHHYGVSNQTEYDQSMKIIEEALKGYDAIVFGGSRYSNQFNMYLNGERSEDYPIRSDNERGLVQAEGSIGELVRAGVSNEIIIRVYKASTLAIQLLQGKEDPLDGSPRSIYDGLVRGKIDCDPIAETYSAVFDSLGFNTMIIGGSNHAEVLIEINGSWWETASNTFRKVDVSKALANGSIMISHPTDGTIIH
ncbi:MAG: copper amine oxidase N-terminal domain-containing protein [Paenibacillus dendritiformis]|uniref:copper amine oxidase N-terminal domain-containing protein n=1 Tax=uncultured Paenibacillus sp. TaxID=227322 RepID=UPI0025EE00B5|nr:copper amine oxidase N-terminal domain-containing protein [uncultured Paenibacillus sp.]MDU5141836.1 copper amine oxidase N-terminal domain-containing protein [Paenibacillus dendritiformis]